MTCALIVVDMQNDFLVKDGYYYRRNTLHHDPKRLAKPRKRCRYIPITHAHRQFIDRVCKAVIAARARDWSVAFLRAVYSQTFDDRPSFLRFDRHRQHHPCRPRSCGAELVLPIRELRDLGRNGPNEVLVDKHTFDGFHHTTLDAFLRAQRIRSLFVVGVETHACVLATSMSAAIRGFQVTIIADCVRTSSMRLHDPALNIVSDAFGNVAMFEDVFHGAI